MAIQFKTVLVRLRRDRQLSQAQLAEQLYVSRQAISKWEQGENTPDLETLVKLAALFEVSLDELVLGEQGAETATTQSPASRTRAMNGWEFLSRYWWLVFGLLGMIGWLISVTR
ncbi:helix-turn-helix transcriptional regulator [Lactiplantibacillus pingfangensis]|uniref:helix-turn-helix transcriptional regulator n=1 Tax=Lactiplantibacillus pingfangensis TaxID=2559915 RepID=UPI0010FA4D45|nr:helix-turn-helix transcriptional regulator [Lactiplantibacillus pingfangensis]